MAQPGTEGAGQEGEQPPPPASDVVRPNTGVVRPGSGQGAALDQSTDTTSDNQWWRLVPATTSGYYRLTNVHNGWCADVSGGSTADGASVIQWAPTSGTNQEWQLIGL